MDAREYGRQWRAANKDKCRAYKAKLLADPAKKERDKQNKLRYRHRCKEKVFAFYGAYCHCPGCNVTEKEFLCLDHVNNDGASHRRQIHSQLYVWLCAEYPNGDFPKDRFQVLCQNCNSAKWIYGACPHLKGTVETAA